MIKLTKVISLLATASAVGIFAFTSSDLTLTGPQTQLAEAKALTPEAANQKALNKGNVPKLWSQGYKGQGMVVAVLDSGIQNNHEFVLSNNDTARITKTDAKRLIAQKGYGTYVSPKIPFAYDYVNNSNSDVQADNISGYHGLMVGGVVAANGAGLKSNTQRVQGVAPEAQLLNMKMYGGFSDEWPSDIAKAIYDAVDLGADVINMSLGIGVPAKSLTDQEQAAVKYATDHGVFVAVAGSNFGHSGSINNGYNEQSNSTVTAYESANSGTISDPAVSPFATTVGDENIAAGDKSEMDSFSAWGPTPEFTLKPDVSAPGQRVGVLDENNHLTTDTGTSFASPYIAGAAALIMQKLKKTQPDLKGANLVRTVRLQLMNTVAPMADDQYPGEIVSPRTQGAGQVNVRNAANLNAVAFDPSSTSQQGSVSLRSIGQTTSFKVAVTNLGSTPATYHVNTSNGPFTEVRETNKHNVGPVHDTSNAGASLKPDTTDITVAPGKTANVNFTLDIGSQAAKNEVAEGYVTFKNSDATQNLTVPYFGYYGDPTQERVVDKPVNQPDNIFGGNYLLDTKNMPLGLSDRTSLASWLNTLSDPDSLRDSIVKRIQSDKVAFSPNGDGRSDTISPLIFTTQDLQHVTAEITDSKGNVVRTIDQENNTQKSIQELTTGYTDDLSISPSMRLNPKALDWNGMAYDQSTGKMRVVPDGQYHYVLKTTNYNDGTDQDQTTSLPVKVDTVAPKINQAVYHYGLLTVRYSDVGAGFTNISALAVKIASKSVGVSLNNNGQTNSGHLVYNLSAAKQKALKNAKGHIQLQLADVAGNQTKKTISTSPTQYRHVTISKKKGSQIIWTTKTNVLQAMWSRDKFAVSTRFTPTAGIKFSGLNDNNYTLINAASKVYNSATHQLTIAGKVANPKSKLTILRTPNQEAAINQVKIQRNGKFTFEMPLNPTTQRGIGYILQTQHKHKTVTAKGTLVVMVDTTLPTLNLSDSAGNDSQITTNHPTFTISGSVDDNVDGYRLFINGDNIFHEQNDAGWVNDQDPGANPNPHGPHQFSQTFDLKDGQNIFKVSAVDETGNTVTKSKH